MKRRSLLHISCLASSLFVSPTVLGNQEIHAIVTGSGSPATATWPETAVDEDFTYIGNETFTLVGNGIDDQVLWSFDFSNEPAFVGFFGTLSSARLSLTFTPKNRFYVSDQVGILGLEQTISPIDETMRVNQSGTAELELLDIYSSSEIMSALLGGEPGAIPMVYSDDSILTHAELVLTLFEFSADFSRDGDVDDEDLGLLFALFTGPDVGPPLLLEADLSGDGDVDDEDLGLAFSQFTGPLSPTSVPEPASAVLFACGALIAARRRR